MSIVTTLPVVPSTSVALHRSRPVLFGMLLSLVLVPISLLILGYHPYAEDGGLYLTGVKYLLNPTLYPHLRQFVTAPIQYSVFAPCIAFLVRHVGVSFDWVVFLLFLITIWATIFASWCIAQTCFASSHERVGATFLVALWMSLPIAGTSLMMIDPYLTARSFSTPFVLFGVACALRSMAGLSSDQNERSRKRIACSAACILVAAAFHPLMAGYGAVFVLAIIWLGFRKPHSTVLKALVLLIMGLLISAATQVLSPLPSAAVTRVALTRSYWFLSQWKWFEILGLLAPLAIILATLRSRTLRSVHLLAKTTILVGVISLLISLCFARSSMVSFGVAHLQPLRVFQVIYFALLLVLGASLGRALLARPWWTWGIAVIVLGTPLTVPAWMLFPHSPHIEWPVPESRGLGTNPWANAFLWIRHNTPADAFFALDANYISDPEDDAQGFRALAERSSLPDYSKDGGETAVNPALSEAWVRGVDAQQNLSSQDDAARYRTLRSLGVTWMILRSDAHTSSPCPYDNGTVKVCRLGSGGPSPA